MACLEVTCAKCNHTWHSNMNADKCPKCGNAEGNHVWFDEQDTPDYPDDFDYTDE